MSLTSFTTAKDFQVGQTLLVDKPIGWTSFDVVNKIRFALRHKLNVKKIKVGHSGTLDPMATGLLIICTGKMTKTLHDLQGLDKIYSGEITLGATTPTYDAESEPENHKSYAHLKEEMICTTTKQFQGEICQQPPIYSAIKTDGISAYKLARRGKDVKLEPRKVTIHSFEIIQVDLPKIAFRVHCSKGFYVRSLAHDFGQKIGTGGYLSSLRRISIGKYHIQDAWHLPNLIETIDNLPLSDESI